MNTRRPSTRSLPGPTAAPAAVVAGLLVLLAIAAVVPVTGDIRIPSVAALAPMVISRHGEMAATAAPSTPRFGPGMRWRGDRSIGSVGVLAAASWRVLDLPPPTRR